MNKTIRLSSIALVAAALAVAPASAVSLNLGGDGPLVDLSNDNNDNSTVSVDTGNLLGSGSTNSSGGGSDGDGGSSTGGGGTLGLDLGLDGGGDGGLVDLGGDGQLLDLGGDDETDAAIEIDLGSTGSVGDTGGLLNLGTDGTLIDLGGDDRLLDLTDGNADLLALNLDGTDAIARSSLTGSSDAALDVDIVSGDGGLAGTGLLEDTTGDITLGGDNVASISLTGTGDGSDGGDDDGNNDGNDDNGNGGDGDNGNGGGATTVALGADVSASAGVGDCLTITGPRLDELVQRHQYNWSTFSAWADARTLKVVEVDICDRAVAEVDAAIEASANVARLQSFLATQAKVRAGLQSTGHSTSDVIAADQSGSALVVYVLRS